MNASAAIACLCADKRIGRFDVPASFVVREA
jgi:hypothetical protein